MYIFSMSKKKKGFHVSAEIFEKQWHICLSVKVHCGPACHWGWGAGNTWAFYKGCLPGSQACPTALNGVGQAGRQLGQFWASCTSRGTELCWTISPQVGVKIRPNEGKQDHTPPWDGQTGPWGWDGLRMGQDGSLKVVPWNGCALSRCKHSCDTVVTADQARAQNESCSLKSPPKRMKGQPSLRPSIIAAWQPLPKGTSCTTLAISPVLQTPRVQWGSIQDLDCNFQGKYFL